MCADGNHRWPQGGCDHRLLSGAGTRKITTCNDCLATKVHFRVTVRDEALGRWVTKESEFLVEPDISERAATTGVY